MKVKNKSVMLSRRCSVSQPLTQKQRDPEQKHLRMTLSCSVGFTLIELLVVVLIIGILSAIALPQYEKAVEKARLSEALINIDMIQKAMDIYRLQYGGFPADNISLKDILEASGTELSNGEWDEYGSYFTKNFEFWGGSNLNACALYINRLGGRYYLELNQYISSQTKVCATNNTDIGKKICNQFKAQGWEYYEGEL